MKVTNTSDARVRIVNPHRWVKPGETVEVDDAYGRGLLAQPAFKPKPKPEPKSEPTAADGTPPKKEQD